LKVRGTDGVFLHLFSLRLDLKRMQKHTRECRCSLGSPQLARFR
jgi:hypothetical protein